jgi:hypothetical protein
MPWLFLGEPMKVKTFTGTHTFAVDSQVNNWLARSNVKVRKDARPMSPSKRSEGGWAPGPQSDDASARAIATTVWYDEPYHQPPKSIRPLGFSNQANGFGNNTLGGHLSEWN